MVLVVDDHADTLAALVMFLQKNGYATQDVCCGLDALVFLQSNTPRLVLLDDNIPELIGLDVLREMKLIPRLAYVPTSMFSAHDTSLRQIALDAGVSAYVVKGSPDWVRMRADILRLAGLQRRSKMHLERFLLHRSP